MNLYFLPIFAALVAMWVWGYLTGRERYGP